MLHGYTEPHSVTRAILDTHRKTVGAVKRDSFRLPPPPGKVLEALDRERLANHTLVYFTSDNGGRLEAQDRSGQLGGWNGRYRGDACGWAWSPRSARWAWSPRSAGADPPGFVPASSGASVISDPWVSASLQCPVPHAPKSHRF